ncbi:DUF3775 domain-containing protein [Thiohalophilus sp.]|uniref:DUF3775 domain-containing protein n=1 Tax=Thiohalophilus sp. TaxID=3028392 RepID=UPI0039771C6C
MLELNPERICNIIQLAREFHAKEAVVIPERPNNSSDDWALQVLADHRDDPVYQELSYAIDDMEPDQQAQLLALAWLGREDYALDEWDAAVRMAVENLVSSSARQIIAIPYIADYLEEGLRLHGYRCEG